MPWSHPRWSAFVYISPQYYYYGKHTKCGLLRLSVLWNCHCQQTARFYILYLCFDFVHWLFKLFLKNLMNSCSSYISAIAEGLPPLHWQGKFLSLIIFGFPLSVTARTEVWGVCLTVILVTCQICLKLKNLFAQVMKGLVCLEKTSTFFALSRVFASLQHSLQFLCAILVGWEEGGGGGGGGGGWGGGGGVGGTIVCLCTCLFFKVYSVAVTTLIRVFKTMLLVTSVNSVAYSQKRTLKINLITFEILV